MATNCNYANLCKMIDKAAEAYLDEELDPQSAGAQDLVKDVTSMYAVKNNADQIRHTAKHNTATLKSNRTATILTTTKEVFGTAGGWWFQNRQINKAFIAEEAGRVLTTKTYRDFVSRTLRLK